MAFCCDLPVDKDVYRLILTSFEAPIRVPSRVRGRQSMALIVEQHGRLAKLIAALPECSRRPQSFASKYLRAAVPDEPRVPEAGLEVTTKTLDTYSGRYRRDRPRCRGGAWHSPGDAADVAAGPKAAPPARWRSEGATVESLALEAN